MQKKLHSTNLQFVIKNALKNGKLIALMVDDYTNIRAFRRPISAKNVDVAHMATVIIRLFDLPAIPASGHRIAPGKDPAGIDIILYNLGAEFEDNITDKLKPFTETAP